MIRIAAAVLISALAAAALAQQSPLVESIEVRVANVDVVVRDKAGNPVNGLAKDDFELYEDGKLQPLTNFYEIRRGEETAAPGVAPTAQPSEQQAPPELMQRRAILFFDAASLSPQRTKAVLPSVMKFIDSLRPEDRAMIVVWHLGVQVLTRFTNDKAALRAGVESLKKFAPVGSTSAQTVAVLRRQIEREFEQAESEQGSALPAVTFDQVRDEGLSSISRLSVEMESQQLHMLDAIREISGRMAGLEGKRVLLFVGETLAEKPGADLYRWLKNLLGTHMGDNDLELSMENSGRMGQALDNLARDVSANGVTIYAIGAASDAGETSAEGTRPVDQTYTFAREANTASSLQNLAEGTGGVAITRTSNFDLAFDTIQRDLSSYYSLGYKPSPGTHKIVVKAKNKAYSVRTRNTFTSKSTDDQMTDRVVANLYTDAAHNDWPLAIRIGQMQSEGKEFLVPVQVVIPSTITLLPQSDGSIAGGFTLYFVAGTADGNISPVLRRPKTFAVPPAAEPNVRAKPMTFSTALKMKPGQNVLSVAIVDQISGVQGFARASVDVK